MVTISLVPPGHNSRVVMLGIVTEMGRGEALEASESKGGNFKMKIDFVRLRDKIRQISQKQ